MEGDFERLGGYFYFWGVFWSFLYFFMFVDFFDVFLTFLKGNKFVFFLAPNSGEQRKDLFAEFKHKKVKSTLD